MITGKNRWRPDDNKIAFHKIFGQPAAIPIVYGEEAKDILNRCNGIGKVIVFADTETTGLTPAVDQIIQFSAIKYRFVGSMLVFEDEMNQFIKNKMPIPEEVTKVNHISESDLADAPTEHEAHAIISKFLGDQFVFIAYNTPFDAAFMSTLYERANATFSPSVEFDVMAMVIDMFSVYQCQSKKLSSVAKYLGLTTGSENFHDSLEDIKMTVKVFAALVKAYSNLPMPTYSTKKRKPNIFGTWYWENPNKYAMKRLYMSTDCGKFFFEILDRSLGCAEEELSLGVEKYDMAGLLDSLCQNYGEANIESLSHIRFK